MGAVVPDPFRLAKGDIVLPVPRIEIASIPTTDEALRMFNQTEQLLLQTQGKVSALEAAFKILLAMQLATRMKGPEDFAKGAELAGEMRDACLKLSPNVEAPQNPVAIAEFNRLFVAEFEGVIRRCFDQTSDQFQELGDMVLRVIDPASPAKQ